MLECSVLDKFGHEDIGFGYEDIGFVDAGLLQYVVYVCICFWLG